MSRARELSKLGNANAISVDTSNNVGLGTTTSIKYKLDVVGDANFVGVITATSFYDADGAVGGGGGASKVYSNTIFAYQNIVQSDITIESPYLTGTIYASEDVTVDIEDDVTVTVNDGAVLNIITI